MGAIFTRNKSSKGPNIHSRLIENNEGGEDEFESVVPAGQQEKLPYPKSVFYILTTEFCERFSFYGMKTILVLYLKYQLKYTEDTATIVFHLWSMMCHFTPILGALLADILLGRYRTILWLSMLYLLGNFTVSLSSVQTIFSTISAQNGMAVTGLLLVAVGTGGIKPCVSAFGGEQFRLPQQQKQLDTFFSVFYFCINFGALLSTLITPILREDVECFGGQCYFAAFGLPAILMLIAIVVFVCGSSVYKRVPASGTIMTSTASCIWLGLTGKVKSMSGKAVRLPHWLDHARGVHDDDLVEDVRVFTSIVWLFLPLPVFWALFDQQGSRWTFQAARMDGHLGTIEMHPDQIQLINPLLILTLVPVMEKLGYPFLAKFGWLKKPLQRVCTGGVLAGVAFAIAAILESRILANIEAGEPPLSMMWLIPQYFFMTLGEVLFSISGLQFSFTEAPASMKSVMQACWLLTVSFGNLLVVIITLAARMKSQTEEFALFSGLMFLDMILFSVMAYYYQPYRPAKQIDLSPPALDKNIDPSVPPLQNGSASSFPNNAADPRGYQLPPVEDDPSRYSFDDLKNKLEKDETNPDPEKTDHGDKEINNSAAASDYNVLPSYSPLNKPPSTT